MHQNMSTLKDPRTLSLQFQPQIYFLKLTTDFQGSLKLKQDWLAQEDFTRLQAKATDLVFCKLNILPWSRALY